MEDEFQDELNEPTPQLTEDAIASMEQFNQEAAYSANINPVEDQGQVDGQQTSQQTGSTEQQKLEVPEEEDTRTGVQKFLGYDKELTNKAKRGEKVTFADTFAIY